jgi:hypothetical protein
MRGSVLPGHLEVHIFRFAGRCSRLAVRGPKDNKAWTRVVAAFGEHGATWRASRVGYGVGCERVGAWSSAGRCTLHPKMAKSSRFWVWKVDAALCFWKECGTLGRTRELPFWSQYESVAELRFSSLFSFWHCGTILVSSDEGFGHWWMVQFNMQSLRHELLSLSCEPCCSTCTLFYSTILHSVTSKYKKERKKV